MSLNQAAVEIHPTSIVEKGAELDKGVVIGPYCVISAKTKIGKNTRLHSHVVCEGRVSLGEGNELFPFVTLGGPPQDIGYKNEDTCLVIGSNNILREGFSANRASTKDKGVTTIGNHNFLMGYTHVAHDCVVGNHIIMANGSGLAGHCSVDDFANIGGFVGIQQKARLGSYCFLAGGTLMRRDLAPFMAARGESEVVGPNLVGLRRAGFDQQQTRVIREIFKIFYNKTLTAELALKKISEEFSNSPQAKLFLDFTAKTVIGVQR